MKHIKGRQMGHYEMVSALMNSYQLTLDFSLVIWCYIKKKSFQTTQGGH